MSTKTVTSAAEQLYERVPVEQLKQLLSEKSTLLAFIYLLFIVFLAVSGPMIIPYEYDERVTGDDGGVKIATSPSADNPLGTTDQGYDVLSRVVYGAQPTAIAALVGGLMIISIGLSIGVVSGYVGGWIDDVLMRFTDVVYGIPLIPFALVLISILGIGFFQSIVVIGLILWRGSARVIRSQTLQIRERPFIMAAEASGVSTPRIILRHIIPNVLPMAVLFFALGAGYTVIVQAGLAFIGVSNPFVPSWGIMIRNAYSSGLMTQSWWWALTPGFLLSLTILSLFMLGRGYEKVATDEESEATVAAG